MSPSKSSSLTSAAGFPDLSSLLLHLRPWKGARALIISTNGEGGRALGNNGDDLMHAVFYRILEQAGIELVDDEPDVVFVPPSGGLLEIYAFPNYLERRLRGLEAIPLVVFPSSAYFPTKDPSYIFEGRVAPTIMFLREQNSFEHLASDWGDQLASAGVELVLDHDVVASGHEFVPSILGEGPRGGGGVLIAARIDREAASVRSGTFRSGGAPNMLHRVANRIPYGRAYTAASRLARRRRNMAAARRLAATASVPVSAEDAQCIDVSARQFATFDEYRTALLRTDVVITDRLHVALPAAIMGKEVTMVEAGYFKLGGVYKRSLMNVSNVSFIDTKSPSQ